MKDFAYGKVLFITVAAFLPAVTFAHTGSGETAGFSMGFLHPVTGLDHVLAMLAVGIWAVYLGGRSLWILPAAFIGLMVLGAVMGLNGTVPHIIELGILVSVMTLGLLVATGVRLPALLGTVVIALFGLIHGVAHGTELAMSPMMLTPVLGFVMMTALLHAGGITLGHRLLKLREYSMRLAGAAVASAGLMLALV